MAKYLVAEIPLGTAGLYGTNDQTKIPVNGLVVAQDISLEGGGLRKDGGSARYNTTAATGAITGGYCYAPIPSTYRQIVAVGGYMLRATGTTTGVLANISTGLNTSVSTTVFVEGGKEAAANSKRLYGFNGYNLPFYIDGDASAIATVSITPSDWAATATGAPTFGFNHVGRMWGGGNANDPYRLYYTGDGNHNDYTTSGGSLAVYPGEGEKLVAGTSFKGFIVCWKYPRGIYVVDTTSATIANWRVDRISNSIGIAGPRAFAVIEDDVVFLDASGQFNLLSVINFENKTMSNISRGTYMGEWIRDNINMGRLNLARMQYYPHKREVHCALTRKNFSVNNVRVILDFNDPEHIRFRVAQKDECGDIWMTPDSDNIERPTIGDSSGVVYFLDQDARNKNDAGYVSKFQTPYNDFSHLDPNFAVIQKNYHWLEMQLEPKGSHNMNVEVFIDGNRKETIDFSMGFGGVALGTFLLGTDTLAGSAVLSRKHQLHGAGNKISLAGGTAGKNEDFNISRMFIHFTPGKAAMR